MRNAEIYGLLPADWTILLVVLCADVHGATLTVSAEPQAIIIDHTCLDISDIPQKLLDRAAPLRILMRHASVGTGIDWGLDCMAGDKPTNPPCSGFPPGKYDRSNWVLEQRAGNWQSKMDDLAAQVATRADDFDIFMTKLCYIDALGDSHPDWDYCRDTMEQLEANYPGKRFVWWTIPLTRDGMPGTDWFNETVRTYCAANNKTLFDIADIECHDLAGARLTNAQGNETISAEYTNEIHAGHLNKEGRIRVASAMWHLMTQLSTNHQTIQSAIDAASEGDEIIVSPGHYRENLHLKGVDIILRSSDPTNTEVVAQTIIDGRFWAHVVTFAGSESSRCVLSGFTITKGRNSFWFDGLGGGIFGNGTLATIEHNLICNNHALPAGMPSDGLGGGIYDCDGIIQHNRIVGNEAWGDTFLSAGGGLYGCDGIIRHNVIAGNKSRFGGGLGKCNGQIINCTIYGNFGGGLFMCEGLTTNCIIWGNGDDLDRSLAAFSCVEDDDAGEYNIHEEPCLVDPGYWDPNEEPDSPYDDIWIDGDYHLKSEASHWDSTRASWLRDDVTSPCIDTGDPMTPIGHEPFPNGGLINMGAYGGTAEASKSYFNAPVCETIVAGDINGDCLGDYRDFAILALHWLEDNNP